MQDDTPKTPPPDKLPGNHGQFGESIATEDDKPLQNHPAPGDQGAKQTNAGERS